MKIFIIVVVVLLLVLTGLFAYYGGFRSVTFNSAKMGGETVVVKKITGEYKQSAIVMDEVYNILLNDFKIETFKGYGKYYDNPKKVEQSKLRSEAGSIIEIKDIEKLKNLPQDYIIDTIPKKNYLTTEFPYKGTMSILVSLIKVYPALNDYVKKNSLNEDVPVVEIYDVPNNKIIYLREITE